MKTRLKTASTKFGFAAGLLVAVAAASPAHAVSTEAFGSFGLTPLGNLSVSGGSSSDITTGTTSITLPGVSAAIVNAIATTYLGHSTNLSLTYGEAPTFSSTTISVPNGIATVDLSVTLGTYVFNYTKEETEQLTASSQSHAGNISLLFNGTFTDTSGQLASGSADMSVSLTQSAPGSSINASFSLDTPKSLTLVPEPISIALFGTGVLGLGLVRRPRRS